MKKSVLLTILSLLIGSLIFPNQAKNEFNGTDLRKSVITIGQNYDKPEMVKEFSELLFGFINAKIKPADPGKSITSGMSEIVYKSWNGTGWDNVEKDQSRYDDNGFAYEAYNFIWENNAWVNNSYSVITNDPEGKPTFILMKIWSSGIWNDFMQIFYTYNASGNPSELLLQINIGTWMNLIKATFFYNAQNQGTEIITQGWDIENSVWINDSRDAYTYNGNGWMIEELSQMWDGTAWANNEIGYLTYEPNGHETEKLKKIWTGSSWENELHFTYSYNAQWLNTSEVVKIWYNDAWINSYQIIFTYDAQERVIEELQQDWAAKGWVNSSLSVYTYDLLIGINNFVAQQTPLVVTPNPVTDLLLIQCGESINGLLEICNSSGQLVYSEIVSGSEVRIDLSRLENGIYIINIKSEKRFERVKFLKM